MAHVVSLGDEALKNPAFASLVDIWSQHVKDGKLPSHAVFFQKFPDRIKSHCVLARIDRTSMDVYYTLAGSALERLYGEKMEGRHLKDLYSPWIRKTVLQSYKEMLEWEKPMYQRRTFAMLLRKIGYERLLLPLEDSEGYAWAVVVVFPTSADIAEAQDWQRLVAETPWFASAGA